MISGTKITPLQRAEIPELRQFLVSGFGVPETASCFSDDVLLWKYLDGPNGHRDESLNSLISRSAGKIVGHIGICPRQFVVSGAGAKPVSAMHAIDWLVSPEQSGSGAFLMLKAFGTSDIQYAIGGSEQAKAVFPKLGFEPKPKLISFRKVLVPFHRLRSKEQGWVRRCAGAAKDAVSVWQNQTPPVQHPVELRQAHTFTEDIDGLVRQSSSRIVTCQRDHLLLNYFLRYPLSGFSGWTIHSSQRMIGCALLAIIPKGAIKLGRIVDCWLDTDDPHCWQAAIAALVNRLRVESADTVTCYATASIQHSALLWNGFTKSGESDVYIRDKKHLLPQDLPLGFSMLEADHAIL